MTRLEELIALRSKEWYATPLNQKDAILLLKHDGELANFQLMAPITHLPKIKKFYHVRMFNLHFETFEENSIHFSGAELTLCRLYDCHFQGVHFTDTKWNETYVRRSRFVDCDFHGADLGESDITEMEFAHCRNLMLLDHVVINHHPYRVVAIRHKDGVLLHAAQYFGIFTDVQTRHFFPFERPDDAVVTEFDGLAEFIKVNLQD